MSLTFGVIVPSQCDLQKHFMIESEQLPPPDSSLRSRLQAIMLAQVLVKEEVNEELLNSVRELLLLLSTPSPETDDAELEEEYVKNLLAEIADGIVDSVYTLFQLANTLHIPFDACFDAVHTNNMQKIQRDAAGNLKKRTDGKLLKPEGHLPPNLKNIMFPPKVEVESKEKQDNEHY